MKSDEGRRLNLSREWDKTFDQSPEIDHRSVIVHSRHGIMPHAEKRFRPLSGDCRLGIVRRVKERYYRLCSG
ncbi:MAG: hypothetical protein ACOX6D_05715 [Thermoguttaceae bacterium]